MRASDLTATELRSLRSLKLPDWWQPETPSVPATPSQAGATRVPEQCLHFLGELFGRYRRPPVLEGAQIRRHHLNPKAIVVVKECGALLHVPGVGSLWQRRGGRSQRTDARRILFRRLWLTGLEILSPSLRAKCRPRWEELLPCADPRWMEMRFHDSSGNRKPATATGMGVLSD
jgi:hypothetical protein